MNYKKRSRACETWVVAILALGVSLLGTVPSAPGVSLTNYVAVHTGGTYDGQSWGTAFTNLQAAVDVSAEANVVLVAGDTYVLTAPLMITNAGVVVRGGYEGIGSGPGNYDSDRWSTVLKRSPAASHRIVHIANGNDAALESLTITGGYDNEGAGLRIENSLGVEVSNCIVSNHAYSANSSTTLRGAGIFVDASSSLAMTHCLVSRNSVGQSRDTGPVISGGGIWCAGILSLRDSEISANALTHARENKTQGGGLYFAGTALELNNVLLSANRVSRNDPAGGVYVAAGTAHLRHCTIADHATAGIVCAGDATVCVTNSIVWGNWNDTIGTVSVGYSNVGDMNYGGNNLSADPRFEYGYYLASASPCVAAGSGTATTLGLDQYARNAAGDQYGPAEIVNLGYHYRNGFDLLYPDLYVSEDGDDTLHDGKSAAQPFRTLTKALSVAHAGTRIHLASGTYTRTTETFPLVINEMPDVRVQGAGAEETLLDASGSSKRVMTLSYSHRAVLAGLTLRGGSANNGSGLNITASQGVLLDRCRVVDNRYSAKLSSMNGGGVYAGASSDVTLTNCIISGNLIYNQHDPSTYRVFGVGIWSSGLLTVRDSMIVDNTLRQNGSGLPGASGLHFAGLQLDLKNVLLAGNHDYNQRGAPGIQIAGGSADISNLTLCDNDGLGLRRSGGTATVVNSILWGNGVDSTNAVTFSYSCLSNSTDHVDAGNNLTANPRFVNAAAGDYRLQDGSPCIDRGMPQSWMWDAHDLAGLKRMMCASVDMGAYEWLPPAGTLFLIH